VLLQLPRPFWAFLGPGFRVSELFTELLPASRSVKILLTYFFYDYSLAIGNNRTGFQSPREAQEKVFGITLPIYLPSTFPLFKEHGSPVQGFIKFLRVSALSQPTAPLSLHLSIVGELLIDPLID